MAIQPPSPSLLAQIRAAQTLPEQIASLKALKNDIIGHQQKKEIWVGLGLIVPVVRILNANKPSIKRNGKGPRASSYATQSLSLEEQVRLQAISIVGSLAHGGPSFIAPLHAAHVLPSLLSNLSPLANPPSLVLATLRTLNDIASSTALASSNYTSSMTMLAEALFSKQHIASLALVIGQQSNSIPILNQINSATKLISRVCREERHQQNLANGGVLDALARRIASLVVSSGCVVPFARSIAQREGILEDMPAAAPKHLDGAGLLEAVAVIITGSKLRASQLLYNPAILAVLPSVPASDLHFGGYNYSDAWASFNASSLSERQSQLNAIDTLLPHIPRQQNRSPSALASAFPPLGTPGLQELELNTGRSPLSKFITQVPSGWQSTPDVEIPGKGAQERQDSAGEEPESPLIPWLFFLARGTIGLQRLMAISVLTVMYRSGLTSKSRTSAFAVLIVPLLAWLISDAAFISKEKKNPKSDVETLSREWTIKERAPAILASLITDNESLQKAAKENDVIKNLSKMLKGAYEPVPENSESGPWFPKVSSAYDQNAFQESQSSKLGNSGLAPLLLHNINIRESALNAMATLVPFKEEYRKSLIDEGVVPYIVESMKTNPSKPSSNNNDKAENKAESNVDGPESNHGYGTNPVAVLIAACNAVRALARSVSILRTTLVDNGVAMPLVNLLQHPDVDVQIAATAAVCNLVLDFSPMRETISEAGIVTILCKHAHSTNAKLKLNAMWALKHLVLSTDNALKKACLRELGQGWLVQLVTENIEDDALTSLNCAGGGSSEGSDITMDDDVDMDHPDSELEDSRMPETAPGTIPSHETSFSRPNSSRSRSLQLAKTRLEALREAERNTSCKALKDDIAVQEQGLDFIRNLIGGVSQDNRASPLGAAEMIDFLFECLEQDRVFEILASKLRSKVITSPTGSRIQPPQPEIIIAVGYILVHMAGSVPRHRQLIIAQTDLLRLLIPQFGHPNKEVKLALCHLVTNLTWVDDSNDQVECRSRVSVLTSLGFLRKLEMLGEKEDEELDVRERAKHAVWQMKDGNI